MATVSVSKEQAQEAKSAYLAAHGVKIEAARRLGLHPATYQNRLNACLRHGIDVPGLHGSQAMQHEPVERHLIEELRQKIKALTEANKQLAEQVTDTEQLKTFIHECKQIPIVPPKWKIKDVIGETTGIPTLLLSDVHFDEVVDPRQIGYVNAYDRDIATRRLRHCFDKTVELCLQHMTRPRYPYITLALGGDLLSGSIHEELAETNQYTVSQSLMALADILAAGIDLLADKFGKVYIPCVVGNHGRLHRKPRAKNRAYDNYEWILVNMLQRLYRGKKDDRVHFEIADGPDLLYTLYNTRYLLTHGDQARGGSGIAGALSPLMLMDHRKRKRAMAVRQDYDYLVMGHWHQYMAVKGMIVNGSVKGYCEWSHAMNFEYEVPTQAMWVTNKDYRITASWPIYLESPVMIQKGNVA